MRVNRFRGIEHYKGNAQNLWGWLFYQRKLDNTIELSSTSINRTSLLRIYLGEPKKTVDFSEFESSMESAAQNLKSEHSTANIAEPVNIDEPVSLIFEYEDKTREDETRHMTSKMEITPEGLKMEKGSFRPFSTSIFCGTKVRFPTEDAERFSELVQAGQVQLLLKALEPFEPKLRGLSVLVSGGTPILHADIGHEVKIPLPLMGEGISRLLSMVLAIAEARKGGLILIDEIENGVHHSTMETMWKAIANAVKVFNVQVVATTHSLECINAASKVFKGDKNEVFCLHRLERVQDTIRSFSYDSETLQAALRAELEVR